MTFPVVATTGTVFETVDTTTHDVPIPSGIIAGDRLMMFVALDGNTTTISGMPSGWTLIDDHTQAGGDLSISVWEKINATGAETAFTFTSSAAEISHGRIWRIGGTHASTATESGTGILEGFGTAVNFTTLNPSGWDIEDTLWIAVVATDGNRTATAYPTSYADNQYTGHSFGGVSGAALHICSRNLAAASEEPGDLTINTNGNWIAFTLGIRPAAGAVADVLNPMGMMGFFGG